MKRPVTHTLRFVTAHFPTILRFSSTKIHKELRLRRSSDSKQETICKSKRAGHVGTLSASRGVRLGAKLWEKETFKAHPFWALSSWLALQRVCRLSRMLICSLGSGRCLDALARNDREEVENKLQQLPFPVDFLGVSALS